jgi:proteasome accessory factor A
MDKRMFGLDSEYDIIGVPDDREDEAARDMAPELRNGARLNLKTPSHPEYATPECDSLPDLIAHDKAGDRIMEDLGAAAEKRTGTTVHVLKTASRESYQLSQRGEFGRLADVLIPFLVTRQLICGAGKLQGAVYTLSQRPGPRPLISTRAARGFRRLHVTVGDPSMNETTVLLKLGATDLVLRAIEVGAALPDLTLARPLEALHTVSLDITGRTPVPLAGHRALTALDIQREYQAKIKDMAERAGSTPTSRRVLALWERVLDSIETGHLDAIAREIDWVTKYQLIEQHDPSQAAQLDLAYHDVSRYRQAG